MLMADIAHFAGLVAAGIHPSPVPHCDVRHHDDAQDAARPARRLILCRASVRQGAQLVGLPRQPGRPADARHRRQGGRVRGGAAARSSAPTSSQIVANAQGARRRAPARAASGCVSGGTDNHLMLVDLRGTEITGKVGARRRSTEPRITVNKNTVPFEPRLAVRHQRRPHRHAGRHDARHARAGDGADRRADRTGRSRPSATSAERCGVRDDVRALCGRFPIYRQRLAAVG